MVDLGFHPHQCKVCGKVFECRDEYSYKKPETKRYHYYFWFCSWSCLRSYELEREKAKRLTPKQQQIIDLLNAGCTATATAAKVGASYAYVSYVKTKWITNKKVG